MKEACREASQHRLVSHGIPFFYRPAAGQAVIIYRTWITGAGFAKWIRK